MAPRSRRGLACRRCPALATPFQRIALCRDRGPVEIRATSDLRLLATLPASTNLPVYVAEWSADGRFLAVKRDYPSNGTASDKEIWDVSAVHLSTTGENVAKESQARAEAARRLLVLRDVGYDVMAFHPHSSRLLVADRKSVILWDFEQCTEVNRILINGRPHYAQFAPDGESLILKKYCHIGFAADTEHGLVVPVVKDVWSKGVVQLAHECAELAKKARDGKLKSDEMKGGCFSISSLGGIGCSYFTPIVNAPEVAILGVSRAQMKPLWNGQEFAPRLMCPLSLSYDHRVIDGAAAARFIVLLTKLLSDLRRLVL